MGAAIANWPGTTAKTPGTSAVAYVCGYAVGFDNRALLLPVSASIERDTDALTRSLLAKSLDAVGRSGARAGLVLLDAVASASPTASVGFVAASTAGTPRRERHRSPPRFPRSWRTPTSRSARCLTRCASLVGSSGNQLTVLAPAGRLLAGGIGPRQRDGSLFVDWPPAVAELPGCDVESEVVARAPVVGWLVLLSADHVGVELAH
jgi:hypothetical protein